MDFGFSPAGCPGMTEVPCWLTRHRLRYGLRRFARNDEVDHGCDQTTRRANQQKSVYPLAQKYSA